MLQDDGLVLRALERADLARLHAFNNDLQVELAGGGDPPWPQAYERLVADVERRWSEGGRDGTSFAIEVEGEFIGLCALFGQDATARSAELGITIGDRAYWGRGWGTRAVKLLQYAFRYQNLRRAYLHVNGRNERAIHAYRKCGFVEEGRLRGHVWCDGDYDDLVAMGILRDEWLDASRNGQDPD